MDRGNIFDLGVAADTPAMIVDSAATTGPIAKVAEVAKSSLWAAGGLEVKDSVDGQSAS